jgi:hypothetical protein
MQLTSEHVHWILGALIATVSVLQLLYESRVISTPHVRYAVPLVLFALGLETFVDPILHGPAMVHSPHETRQHVAMGVLAFATGAVEFLRLKARLRHGAWGLLFPAALGIVGVLFLFHSQHGGPVPVLALIAQHRFMGITLLLASVLKALAETPSDKAKAFNISWMALLLLFGFELLFYTEGRSIFGGTIHVPSSQAGSSHAH